MYSNNPKVVMNEGQRNHKADRMNRKQIIKW